MGTIIFLAMCAIMLTSVFLIISSRKNKTKDVNLPQDSTIGNTGKRDDYE